MACPVSFGVAHVIPLVASFMHLHPNVRIDLDVNDKRLDLVESGFDMAIRIGHLEDSSYKLEGYRTLLMWFVLRRIFFTHNGYPLHPEDLSELPALCYGNLKTT